MVNMDSATGPAVVAQTAASSKPVTRAAAPALLKTGAPRPTDLVEVCRNLPKDVFEIRPVRAFLAAAQVCTTVIQPES